MARGGGAGPARTVTFVVAAGLVITGLVITAFVTAPARAIASPGSSEVTGPAVATAPASGTVIGPGFYPRLVRLAHAGPENGAILATYQLGQDGIVLRSTDGGATFEELSRIDVGPATTLPPPGGLCCVELFELPRQLGSFPAGTLLWAGSITVQTDPPPRVNDLAIWRSEDHGRTWVPHGSCTAGPGGLWEPELLVAADGSLVCLYSDDLTESQPGPLIGQDLKLTVSTDGGLTFGPPRLVATGPGAYGRPGMSTTAQLPDGTWAMTYELCGWLPPCQVRILFSADGLDWGDPAVAGEVVATADGSTFLHTPVLSWSPFGGPDGTLVLTGQILVGADGQPRPGSGATIFVNTRAGRGAWRAEAAPVSIPDPFDHYCPNYSSPVLPLDGDQILGMATEWTGDTCLVRYATGTLPAPPTDPVAAPTTGPTTSSTSSSPTGLVTTTAPSGAAAPPRPSPAAPAFTG